MAGSPLGTTKAKATPDADLAFAKASLDRTLARGRIAGVAIRHGDRVYACMAPSRHSDIMRALAATEGPMSMAAFGDQGFVTYGGKFLDRYQALQVARAESQLIRKTGNSNELYSEDLW